MTVGPLRKIKGTVYDQQGRIYNLLECGHAMYQRYRWVKGLFRRCPLCAAIEGVGNPKPWHFEGDNIIENGKDAMLEGKRLLALAHFESKGEQPPPILLKVRHSHPLFETPVLPTRRVHFVRGCKMAPGHGTPEEKIITDNPHEVTCLRCRAIMDKGKSPRTAKKRAHYQDCDGAQLCVDSPCTRSDFPLLTTDMDEVTCALCREIIGFERQK